MFEIFRNAWKVENLRKKIIYTLLMLLLYRLGAYVPVAGVNVDYIAQMVNKYSALGFLDLFSGGSFSSFTIFAMGISPYINASIIMNLLTIVIPKLERLSKEGQEGQKVIMKYTRIFTVVLAFIQSVAIIVGLGSEAMIQATAFNYIIVGLSLTAGTALVMWMGERITENGVGNGISLIIFTSIVVRVPQFFIQIFTSIKQGTDPWVLLPIAIFVFVVILGITFIDLGQRRIPVQYAKRVVGRKVYGGQSTYIPIKPNASGVIPIIFALTIMQFPSIIAQFWPTSDFSIWYNNYFAAGSVIYSVIYIVLIVAFTFFYSSIMFDPKDIAKNMQQYGGFIPGIRPGRPTSEYLSRISSRLTFFGGIFLALVAAIPMMFKSFAGISSVFGATSVLILVSVALETAKQLESQMLMRNYKGFL